MEEIFGKIKEQADKVKGYAKKFGKTTVDKTNTVVNQTKLKLAISKTEDKINEVYAEIGAKLYESYKEGISAPDVKEAYEKLDELQKEAEDLKEQLSEISETVKCQSCGASNSKNNAYCSKCGEKLEETVYEAAKEAAEEFVDTAAADED